MELTVGEIQTALNQSNKKMNIIYHNYAKTVGLSDAAFWLLYSLLEHGCPCTQKYLHEAWYYPPQTINSALKSLEKRTIIRLELISGSRKNKRIVLTPKGEMLVKEKIIPLVCAEERSFERLDKQQRNSLLEITQKHVSLLEEEINKIL